MIMFHYFYIYFSCLPDKKFHSKQSKAFILILHILFMQKPCREVNSNNQTIVNVSCPRPRESCSLGPFHLPVDGRNMSVTFCSHHRHHKASPIKPNKPNQSVKFHFCCFFLSDRFVISTLSSMVLMYGKFKEHLHCMQHLTVNAVVGQCCLRSMDQMTIVYNSVPMCHTWWCP